MERAIFSEKTCSINQECISYKKCPHTKKLCNQIISTKEDKKKDQLMQEMKNLVCGSYTINKTVCCDLHNPCEPNPCGPQMKCLTDYSTK